MTEPDRIPIAADHLLPAEQEARRRKLMRFVTVDLPDTDDFRELAAAHERAAAVAHDSRTLIAAAAQAARDAHRDGTGDRAVTAEEAVAALELLPAVEEELRRDEVALIEAARDAGHTWSTLGDALGGRSRQAMQQHYRRIGGARRWPEHREVDPPPGSRSAHDDDRGWLPAPGAWKPDYAIDAALTEGISTALNGYAVARDDGDYPALRWTFVYGRDPEDAPSAFYLEGWLAADDAPELDPGEQFDELEDWIRLLGLTERPAQFVHGGGREWWGYVHATPAVLRTIDG
ncbi:hypothetical protein [Saccharothrix sp. HUAS TT1]|uniref:hypothetical protein n=1 Tax=unclassified Saccharothrix TaxID=2593673 RepID=UPI00345C3924